MKTGLLICLITLLIPSGLSAQKNNSYWGEVSIGSSNYGETAYSIGVNFIAGIFSGGMKYTNHRSEFRNKPDLINEISLLGGINYRKYFFKANKVLVFTAAFGPSYYLEDKCTLRCDKGNIGFEKFITVGMAAEAKVSLRFGDNLGIGISTSGNLNEYNNLFVYQLVIQIGGFI